MLTAFLERVKPASTIANTQYPIIHKNTKISHEHLRVFKAFQIESVLILDDNLSEPIKDNEDIRITQPVTSSYKKLYDEAIIQFKREFKSWEAGALRSYRFLVLLIHLHT